MVTRRTLLLYNFGLALTLLVCGVMTIYALDILGHDSVAEAAYRNLRAKAAKDIVEDSDLEHLRATAEFYLKQSDDLKRSKDAETAGFLKEIRYGCLLMAGTFAIGGLLALAMRISGAAKPE